MSEFAEGLEKKTVDDTPQGKAQRWTLEFAAARRALDPWHKVGEKIDKEFRNEVEATTTGETRLNLFTADVTTMMALMHGQTPRVSVSRRFADAKDDDARVAGEMLERLLNCDIARDEDGFQPAIKTALSDRLLPGLANCRVRYTMGETETIEGKPAVLDEVTGQELAPEVPERESRPNEDADTDYVHWQDQLWSPCRVWQELQWWSFKNRMDREALIERFGEKIGSQIPLNSKRVGADGSRDPWGRADVWEIYDKTTRTVCWFVEGFPTILDEKPDPLELDGFWPFAEPMFANITTSKLVPRPDFAIHQDQYNEVHNLETRLHELSESIRVSGLYNAANENIPDMLSETGRGKMIPVKNWAMHGESGGLRGQTDWFPLEQVVGAIQVLQERLSTRIDLLRQATGWSDIMRGEATQAGATATEQRVKARSGSVRIQRLQDEFARFASGIQKLRAEIICKHFEPSTIIARSNAERFIEDPQQIQRAVALLKSPRFAEYRIEVKPEALAIQDFAATKQERTEVLASLTQFFQAMAPLAQGMPGSMPHLLEMAQWSVSGLRGASQIEGTFDRMITEAKQAAEQAKANPQQPPPDPKIVAAQMKNQGEAQKLQGEMLKMEKATQLHGVELSQETFAKAQQEKNQEESNVQEHFRKQQITNALKPPELPKEFP